MDNQHKKISGYRDLTLTVTGTTAAIYTLEWEEL